MARRSGSLPPVQPNAGIRAEYARRLAMLVGEMHNSVLYWLSAAYKAHEPEMAQDAVPAVELRKKIRTLAKRWQKRFDLLGPEVAKLFADGNRARADRVFASQLRKNGLAVKFRMTDTMRDVMHATVGENVALIKSIPQQYFTQLEVAVMQSASAGRDLQSLTQAIGDKVDLSRIRMGRKPGESDKSLAARTQRRTELIARDQNNKMTAAFNRVRQVELGIKEAIWMHSSAGKEPRPEHVKWGREQTKYDVDKGMWSDVAGKYVWPGTEINCRCTSRSIIPGLSRHKDL